MVGVETWQAQSRSININNTAEPSVANNVERVLSAMDFKIFLVINECRRSKQLKIQENTSRTTIHSCA
jgi:hypothetical protein